MTHIDLQKVEIDAQGGFTNTLALAGVLGHMRYLQGGKWNTMRMKIALEGIENELGKVARKK